jgi:SAM-dependent methyltransferase
MNKFLKNINWFLVSQVGMDFQKLLLSLKGSYRFVASYFLFAKNFNGVLGFKPCLHDWYLEGGNIKNEYFWQDLYVASEIFRKAPTMHVDIGSRIDSFVAHVASFRKIEIFDIRPVTAKIPNVIFRQLDLMVPNHNFVDYADSVSCLHALEHFGLGRYGDPIDVDGFDRGFSSISKILKNNGLLYLSVPIGRPRVEFNAHRISDPSKILHLSKINNLKIVDFSFVKNNSIVHSVEIENDLLILGENDYCLGIFTFLKTL